ncbi:MAG: nickel pincer cofactor biosynthesis protein LarB [Planctomycetes bacterium]|nr:nickel pincer cofactor biosynthesis protein LarB [Planctomycetota bacterium]
MERATLLRLLRDVARGRLKPDAALHRLRALPAEDLGFARVDHHRTVRCGFPEVIFCAGKTPAQIARIARAIHRAGTPLLATRADRAAFAAIRKVVRGARYHAVARCVTAAAGTDKRRRPAPPELALLSAGTSDIPVAEEARVTAEMLGCRVEAIYDVGVAGIHRLLGHTATLQKARAVIVVAGMEGALASVVGGLVDRPVIAVPTSVGYGASFGGIAPLLTMLNSCAAGVAVVNIDNGFGAGYLAAMMARP